MVTVLDWWTSVFEWFMQRLGVKNRHQEVTCDDESRLCAQNKNMFHPKLHS